MGIFMTSTPDASMQNGAAAVKLADMDDGWCMVSASESQQVRYTQNGYHLEWSHHH